MALGATGPVLRSTGVAWDLRRDMPYLHYDQLEFDVLVGSYGDCFDRYAIRLNEVRESMRIVRQILDRMPSGDYRIQDKKVTPPPRARIDESMEALIHHFKIFTEGFKVPEGEAYVGIEGPRGEIGCYIVSDGSAKPYRMHIRPPSFVNLQTLPHMMRGGLIADGVAVISSVDPDPGRGRPLMARLNEANVLIAREIIARYPRPKSALIPLLHLAQEQDGHVTDDAMAHIAELIGDHPGRGLRHGHLLRDVQVRAGGPLLRQRLHQHLLPAGGRLGAAASTPRSASASRPAAPPPTACSRWRTSSASPPAPRRRPCRSTTASATRSPTTTSTVSSTTCGAGRLDDEIPPHGTLARVRQKVAADRWAGTGAEAQAKVDAR